MIGPRPGVSGEGPEWRHAAEVRSWGLTDVEREGGEKSRVMLRSLAWWPSGWPKPSCERREGRRRRRSEHRGKMFGFGTCCLISLWTIQVEVFAMYLYMWEFWRDAGACDQDYGIK